jgi:flagellar biosynthesis component FlhA
MTLTTDISETLPDNLADLIPEQAIDEVVQKSQAMAIADVYRHLRSRIDVKKIIQTAHQLVRLDSDELRAEMAQYQTFLTLDLDEIQRSNWRDILKSDKESLEELLALRREEVKSLQAKVKYTREVELAEVQLAKAKSEQDFDIAMLRLHKVKGHLIAGLIILVVGIFVGQAVEGFNRDRSTPPPKTQKVPPKHK